MEMLEEELPDGLWEGSWAIMELDLAGLHGELWAQYGPHPWKTLVLGYRVFWKHGGVEMEV